MQAQPKHDKLSFAKQRPQAGLCTPARFAAATVCTIAALLTAACNNSLRTNEAGPTGAFVADKPGEAERIILAGLADENPMVRVDAIEAVASTRTIRLMPKVQRMLTDHSEWVRFAAALAVGDTKYTLAAKQVSQMSNDPSSNVRIAAAYAMYKLGSTQSFAVIHNAMASGDPTIQANAALLLGKTGNKDALKILWLVLRSENSDYTVQLKSAEAIARLRDEWIFPKLWATALSAFVEDRIIAVRSIGMLNTPRAKEVLITKLDDEVLLVRLAAAEQLGILQDTTGQRVVAEVFTKNLTARMDPRDREHVLVFTATAIGRINTPQVTKFLPRLLKSDDKAVRIAAAKAVFHAKNSTHTR
jgi:HEAT repeat protein